ncbi:flavodoxin family protein [Desulfovibrio sp. JC010]|uniref:flavodoxin family protein n=1 Tax=Desulfovibrio sp. JC010 TaxID=2593641 RepID=UPI0013D36DA2|nr:flavodoxin family protein [Desulfovibrio sp. JC010]NDV27637.1 flavodoxin family protein [Desulfovibrio sp. JC010]
MKVLCLQGSARKKGHTAKMIEWVEAELKAMGHEAESVYLNDKELKGCMACMKCKEKPEEIGCVLKDDIPAILEQMVQADAVVFASPLYFWGVSAQLKAVIDRTYSLYVDYHMPTHDSLIKGQRHGILITGGGPMENNAEETFTGLSRMQKPHMTKHTATLFLGGCKNPEALGDEAKQKAVEFARDLVK